MLRTILHWGLDWGPLIEKLPLKGAYTGLRAYGLGLRA